MPVSGNISSRFSPVSSQRDASETYIHRVRPVDMHPNLGRPGLKIVNFSKQLSAPRGTEDAKREHSRMHASSERTPCLWSRSFCCPKELGIKELVLETTQLRVQWSVVRQDELRAKRVRRPERRWLWTGSIAECQSCRHRVEPSQSNCLPNRVTCLTER